MLEKNCIEMGKGRKKFWAQHIYKGDRTNGCVVGLDGLELFSRADSSFETVRYHIPLFNGKVYYEVYLLSGGIFQIGISTLNCKFSDKVNKNSFFQIIQF